jgi:hypothetical protein
LPSLRERACVSLTFSPPPSAITCPRSSVGSTWETNWAQTGPFKCRVVRSGTLTRTSNR